MLTRRESYREIIAPRPKRRFAAFCALVIGLFPLVAVAQVTEPILPAPPPPTGPQAPPPPGQPIYPGQTVTERPRPEYDPTGLQVGDFFWFPRVELDEAYNDNIFATPSPTADDLITILQPRIDVLSSLPQHALNLHTGSALQFYTGHSGQNTQDVFGSFDGRIDLTTGRYFFGGAEASHGHTPRTSPDSPGNAAEPVTFNSYTANAGFAQTGLRVGYQAELAANAVRYDAVPLIGGGVSPQSANDVNVYQATVRGNYEFIPDYIAYVRYSENLRIFPNGLAGAPSFNSLGYRADVGLQILPRGIIYGEVYVGYLNQDFRSAGLPSLSGPDAGGRVTWNVTRLTTLRFNALRTVNTGNPSIASTGGGYLASTGTVNLDHELLRNLLLNANAGLEIDDFQGIARTDNVFTAGASVKYLVHRNFYLGLSYAYQQRSSSGASASAGYSQNIVMLRASTQF